MGQYECTIIGINTIFFIDFGRRGSLWLLRASAYFCRPLGLCKERKRFACCFYGMTASQFCDFWMTHFFTERPPMSQCRISTLLGAPKLYSVRWNVNQTGLTRSCLGRGTDRDRDPRTGGGGGREAGGDYTYRYTVNTRTILH